MKHGIVSSSCARLRLSRLNITFKLSLTVNSTGKVAAFSIGMPLSTFDKGPDNSLSFKQEISHVGGIIMKISTKGRYGLRAVLYLALHADQGHVALHQIADAQQLSVGYIEQIFSTLRRSGIVKSVKGAQGGYVLAESPQQIRVSQILRALEGELCFDQEEGTQSNALEATISRRLWKPLDAQIAALLNQLTLEDLVEDYLSHDDSAYMFVI